MCHTAKPCELAGLVLVCFFNLSKIWTNYLLSSCGNILFYNMRNNHFMQWLRYSVYVPKASRCCWFLSWRMNVHISDLFCHLDFLSPIPLFTLTSSLYFQFNNVNQWNNIVQYWLKYVFQKYTTLYRVCWNTFTIFLSSWYDDFLILTLFGPYATF